MMNTYFRKRLLAATAVAGATLLGSGAAQANLIYVGYNFDGGATVTAAGSSGSDGFAAFNTSAGGFSMQASGTGAPTAPQGMLLSNSTTVSSSTAGTVYIYVSEVGNTNAPVSFTTGFGNNSSSSVSILETTYAGGTTAFARVNQIGSATVAPGAATADQVTLAPAALGSPYVITSVYKITYGANGGMTTATLNVGSNAAVPEPAAWAMMIGGFGLAGAALRRRQSVAVKFA